MKDRIFIDTNVLVYIHLFDEESQDKRKALQNLLHRRIDAELIINVQVINEFYNVLLRKREKYKYSYWDSLILASALENSCSILYSEDMQHGQVIEDSLKIINPFKLISSVEG